jgi:hypothetical protein
MGMSTNIDKDMDIVTSHRHSHRAWTRTPGIDMDIYHGNVHVHGHGHRAWTWSPGVDMELNTGMDMDMDRYIH